MTDRATLSHVDSMLNYMAPMPERPRYLAYDPEPGEPRSNMTPVERKGRCPRVKMTCALT